MPALNLNKEPVQPQWHPDASTDRPFDPLLASLSLLCSYYGNPCSDSALSSGLPLEDQRLTVSLLPRAAERGGLGARLVKQSLEDISPTLLPAILLLRDQRACVLLELDGERARLLIPETGSGEEWVSLDILAEDYIGQLFYLKKKHRFDARTPKLLETHDGHWFWGALKRNSPIYRDVAVASLLINLFAVTSPLFVMNVYDRVVPNLAFDTLWVLAFGVIVIFSFDFFLRQLRARFVDIAGKKVDLELSSAIFSRVLNIKLEARPASVGAFANQLQAFELVREFITSATLSSLIDLPFALIFLLVIWLVAGPLVLVPIVAMLVMAGYALYVQRPLARSIEAASRHSAEKHGTLVEILAGLDTVRSCDAQGQMQELWERKVSEIGRLEMETRRLSNSVANLSSYLQQLVTVALVVFGVYLVADGTLSLGGIIAAVMLGGRAVAPMAQLSLLATRYNQFKTSLALIDGIMNMPEEQDIEQKPLNIGRLSGQIAFENVSFSYPEQNESALTNLNFNISPGEKVAVIGRVGAGKSTLGQLILNLYQPQSGAVHLDGINVCQLHPADLRRQIGSVFQDSQLFFGSIRDNILFGAPYSSDEALRKAAHFGGVLAFTDNHELGLERPIGESGRYLSGGQRQAILLARTMLLDPPLLLLDEPTSNLDSRTEQQFVQRLKQLDKERTLIVVTHRTPILDAIDRLIVMDNGRIVADGPKREVLARMQTERTEGAAP
ncbi:MAG: ATP-binding cassette subfamily C protein LapB [Motiliproteus sp.]